MADYKIKPQENLYAPHGINNLILRGHATRPFVNIPMPHSYAEALLISEKERERLKTTTTTLPLSLLYLNLLPGMSVNDGIIEELPNSQKEEGGL